MIKKYLAILLLILAALPLAAQDTWYVGKPIEDLVFTGLDLVSVNELRPIVRPYIGMPFSDDLYWEIQGKLWELDYFEDIIANAREGSDGRNTVVVEFAVKEYPSVLAIKVEGNKKVSTIEILEIVETKAGDFIDASQLKVDEVSISDLYLEKGYRRVTVSSRQEKSEKANGVTIYFVINEGYKTTIKSVNFSGNSFASDSTLRGKVKQKKASLFDTGVFQESLIEEDKARILSYYHSKGYVDAVVEKVDQQIENDEDKERSFINLTYYISEGNQYTYGETTIEGNSIFSDEELLSAIRLKSGDILDKVRMDAYLQQIDTLYTDSGYIFNTIIKDEVRDEDLKILSFKVTVVEREKAHIGSIVIQGNEKTKDYVIYRELPFEVGDIFSTEKLRQGYFNLYNLQYFSNISYNPVPSNVEGLMDMVISVEEQSWADFKFAMVFSGGDFPVSGQIGWADKNFLGNGQAIGVDLEFSNLRQAISLTFQDDYLFGDGWGMGASFSVSHSIYQNASQDIMAPIFTDEDVPDPYTSLEEYTDAVEAGEAITGVSTMDYDSMDITLAFNSGYFFRTIVGKLGLNGSTGVSTQYLWYDDTIYRHYNKTVRDGLEKWVFINTLGFTLYLDDRDIYYNPESGFLLQQDVKFAGAFLLGDRHYIKTKSKAEGFLTLWDIPVLDNWNWQTVLALHGAASFMYHPWINEYSATEREELYVDGMNTARGWDVKFGGKALYDFSVELRSPLVRQYIWTSLFFDAAALKLNWVDMRDLSLQDFWFSIGAGLRLTIPGLPLRFYLAQPFNFDKDGQLQMPEGDFHWGSLNPNFVIAITPPGGF